VNRPSHAAPELGFSLLEIIVALAILSLLAGAGAVVGLRSVRGNLEQRTQQRLRALVHAMIGEPDAADFGYLADMGELPDTDLTQLMLRGAQTAGVADPVDGIVSGWNGPYFVAGGSVAAPLDFWNSSIVYTPGVAQLTSLGPDRQLGTADDIVYPSVSPKLSAEIAVLVRGQLSAGGPPISLRSDEAAVSTFYTRGSDNTRALAAMSYTGSQGSGIWRTDQPVHLGEHGVLVTGLDASGSGGRNYSGAVSREIVRVSRGPVSVTVLLDEAP